MNYIRKLDVWIGIFSGILLNIVIGGIPINQSTKGHSIFGLLIGVIIPIISIVLYAYYYHLQNVSIDQKKYLFRKILQPGVRIGGIILALNLSMIVFVSDGLSSFDLDSLLFVLSTVSIFLIPNIILGYLFFLWLTLKN